MKYKTTELTRFHLLKENKWKETKTNNLVKVI